MLKPMLGGTLALTTALALAVPSLVLGQASARPPHRPKPASVRRPWTRAHTLYGRITYYAERFDGRTTTSGEIYHRDELTAAHRSLPFGSLVRVTNLRNGRSTVVRITDRGPSYHRFQLDVSGRAAEVLGFYQARVARVRLDVLRLGPDSLTELGQREVVLSWVFRDD